jgi:hypothetical protein
MSRKKPAQVERPAKRPAFERAAAPAALPPDGTPGLLNGKDTAAPARYDLTDQDVLDILLISEVAFRCGLPNPGITEEERAGFSALLAREGVQTDVVVGFVTRAIDHGWLLLDEPYGYKRLPTPGRGDGK